MKTAQEKLDNVIERLKTLIEICEDCIKELTELNFGEDEIAAKIQEKEDYEELLRVAEDR